MSPRQLLLFWVLFGALVLTSVSLTFVLVMGEAGRADDLGRRARQRAGDADALRPQAAGARYEEGVDAFVQGRALRVKQIDDDRARLAGRLTDWFPTLTVRAGGHAPAPADFTRAWLLHADRLKRLVPEVLAKAGVVTIPDIVPLMAAPFDVPGLTVDDDAITSWQIVANAEDLMVTLAAKAGAWPRTAAVVERLPRLVTDRDERLNRVRVRLDLFCRSVTVPALLHTLAAGLDEAAVITRVDGMSIDASAADVSKPLAGEPPVGVKVTLQLVFLMPHAGGQT